MTKRASEKSIARRVAALMQRTVEVDLEARISLDEFLEGTGYELSRGKSGNADHQLSVKKLRDTFAKINSSKETNRVIKLFRAESDNAYVIVKAERRPVFELRLDRASTQKEAIAKAMWDFLLQSKLTDSRGKESKSWILVCGSDANSESTIHLRDRIEYKVRRLVRRSQIYFAVDSGTTTLTIIKELLEQDQFPLQVNVGPDPNADSSEPEDARGKPISENEKHIRLIDPVLLTNSIPAVNAVHRNDKHRWTFSVEIVGGLVRANRRCSLGDKAELWIRMCRGGGEIGILDLAIVSATGVYYNASEIAVAGCDDPEEGVIKTSFLNMTGPGEGGQVAGLRVVAFHSSKILYPEGRSRFALFNQAMVDLVVVDEGTNEKEKKAVTKLCDAANRHGVAVLKARLPNREQKK
ncbi:MAG: hypothetical protein AAF591_14435 [Verrucomicrobiota bacterium]